MKKGNASYRPVEGKCLVCGKLYKIGPRHQGGGKRKKYCSHTCCAKAWNLKNRAKRKAIITKYEAVPENKMKKRRANRIRKFRIKYNWTEQEFLDELARQNYSCYGCLTLINEETARVDHCHKKNKVRGLLCDRCNWALGHAKDSAEILRRLMSYLDHDRTKTNVYVIGALKNTRIPEIGNRLRSEGYDVMDEWFTPGEFADTNWQNYEKQRGRSYKEALRGRAATNIFLFDRTYLDLSDKVILVMPAGKSAMIELGYAKGRGKDTYILLDGQDPDRYDIMPNFADHVVITEDDLVEELKNKPLTNATPNSSINSEA